MKYTIENCYYQAQKYLNFQQIHKVMTFLNLTWGDKKATVPTIEQMKKHCKRMFDDCCSQCFKNDSDTMTISSGGFTVYIEKFKQNNNTEYFCKLSFQLEQSQCSTQQLKESIKDD